MMARKFFLLSCFLLVAANVKALDKKVLEYYRLINLAELARCDSNFTAAIAHYKAAFIINPDKTFYFDLTNAFHTAMHLKDYVLAEKYLSQRLRRGMPADHLSLIKKGYNGERLVKLNGMIARHANKDLSKDPLVKRLKEMVVWDQGVRAHYSRLNDGKYMVDSTYTVDNILAQELLSIFKKNGIPNESILDETGYDIMLLHNTGAAFGGRPSHVFDTLLYNAVNNFDFDARHFAGLASASPPQPSFQYGDINLVFPLMTTACFYNKKYYIGYYDEASEIRINNERAKIGLESLDDYRKKVQHDVANFLFVVDLNTEAQFEQWQEKYGKDAIDKVSVRNMKFAAPTREPFNVGIIGGLVMGINTYDSMYAEYKRTGVNEWFVPHVPYRTFEGFKPWHHQFGYFAEIVKNVKEDSNTSTGRTHLARFVTGYTMLKQESYNFWAMGVRKPEFSFYHNILMHFIADVDTVAYQTTMKYIGPPTETKMSADTVPYPHDDKYVVVLKKRRYTWIKGNRKTQITLTDSMDKKGRKVTKAILEMEDIKRYAAYKEEVNKEITRLEKSVASK